MAPMTRSGANPDGTPRPLAAEHFAQRRPRPADRRSHPLVSNRPLRSRNASNRTDRFPPKHEPAWREGARGEVGGVEGSGERLSGLGSAFEHGGSPFSSRRRPRCQPCRFHRPSARYASGCLKTWPCVACAKRRGVTMCGLCGASLRFWAAAGHRDTGGYPPLPGPPGREAEGSHRASIARSRQCASSSR